MKQMIKDRSNMTARQDDKKKKGLEYLTELSDPMSTTRLVPPAPASPEKSFVFNQCFVEAVGLGPKKTVRSSFSLPGPLSLCLR